MIWLIASWRQVAVTSWYCSVVNDSSMCNTVWYCRGWKWHSQVDIEAKHRQITLALTSTTDSITRESCYKVVMVGQSCLDSSMKKDSHPSIRSITRRCRSHLDSNPILSIQSFQSNGVFSLSSTFYINWCFYPFQNYWLTLVWFFDISDNYEQQIIVNSKFEDWPQHSCDIFILLLLVLKVISILIPDV